MKDQNQALAKAQLLAQEAQAQARSLQDRCQSLEQDAASLRYGPAWTRLHSQMQLLQPPCPKASLCRLISHMSTGSPL